MQKTVLMASLRQQALHLLLTLALVMVVTVILYAAIITTGVTQGSAIYLIPVLIAAVRWGVVPALFAGICGVLASAYFFVAPTYTLIVTDPHEVFNLILFTFTAIIVGQLAAQLKEQLELARQREIDLSDLYSFSRRLAVAFDVSDIHSAIEDHLAAVLQRKVILFGPQREPLAAARRNGGNIPGAVLGAVENMAFGHESGGRREAASPAGKAASGGEAASPASEAAGAGAGGAAGRGGETVVGDGHDTWLVRAVSPSRREFGVIAVNLGHASPASQGALRSRIDAVLADATATLERLGVAHAIGEARMRAQTEQLREALIGSVSHELRTPLASILGAATVLAAAPALKNEKSLKALVQGVHDETERLNRDIQNLLDASRISSGGVRPQLEWADPTDILHAALGSCARRLADRSIALDVPQDLPLVHVDAVLVQQALVQIIDNAAKYSQAGSRIAIAAAARNGRLSVSVSDEGAGLTEIDKATMFDRFERGERHAATTSGSGLGLWIADAFITANGGKLEAVSAGPGLGSTLTVELPATHSAVAQLESDADD
jgi:two-component system sensor histidine kinase KdpD